MSEASKQERSFQYAVDFLKLEITLFWQRSLFFWGFSAASFVGYGVLHKEADKDLAVAMSCFGIVCSIAWTLANRGSRWWTFYWRQKVEAAEREMLGASLFDTTTEVVKNCGWWGARPYSVTRLTLALSDFSVIIWIVLATKAAHANSWSLTSLILLSTALLYAIIMLVRTSTDRSRPKISN